MESFKNFGDYLRAHRQKAGLTQMDVSDRLGYSTAQFVSNWERGQSLPPVSALKTIALIYHLPPQELFDRLLAEALLQTREDLEIKFKKSKGP